MAEDVTGTLNRCFDAVNNQLQTKVVAAVAAGNTGEDMEWQGIINRCFDPATNSLRVVVA